MPADSKLPEGSLGSYLSAVVSLSPEERTRIDELAITRTYARGDHLVRQGQRCGHVWFVRRGLVRVYFLRDGTDPTAWFVAEGGFVSDYVSFLTDEPSSMNVEALEATRTEVLSQAAIETIHRDVRHGERLGRIMAEQLFVSTHRRLGSFYLDSAEERYRAFLREHPKLPARVPQHFIASFVGVRPQSLSRIRRRLADELALEESE